MCKVCGFVDFRPEDYTGSEPDDIYGRLCECCKMPMCACTCFDDIDDDDKPNSDVESFPG